MDAVRAVVTVPASSDTITITQESTTTFNVNQSNNNTHIHANAHISSNSLANKATSNIISNSNSNINIGGSSHSSSSNSSCSSSSTSSNSSGYGSSTTTPTNNYDLQQTTPTTTPVPTTPVATAEHIIPVATVAAVTPFYNESVITHTLEAHRAQHHHHHSQQHQHQHQQQQQQHQQPHQHSLLQSNHHQYSENHLQPNLQQTHHQYLPRQQYYSPYDYQQTAPTHNLSGSAVDPAVASYNMLVPGPYEMSSSLATPSYGVDQYKSASLSGAATNYERSSVVKPQAIAPTYNQQHQQPQHVPQAEQQQQQQQQQSKIINQQTHHFTSLLGPSKQRPSSLISGTANTNTSKPQAAATPFYANPTPFYENFKHKMPLEYHDTSSNPSPTAAVSYHQQQKFYAAAKSQLKEASYGSPTGLNSKPLYGSTGNFFPAPATGLNLSAATYDKYSMYPHNPTTGYSTTGHLGNETPPDVSNYRKPVVTNAMNSPSWPWGLDYTSGNSRCIPPPATHIPTATVAPTHATHLTQNPPVLARDSYYMGHDKYGVKYDKYTNPSYQQSYASPPTNRHMWPNTAHTSNLSPLNDRHLLATVPPPLTSHGLHTTSYFPNTAATSLNSRQSCCSQPYQPQSCYYPASHAVPTRQPHSQTPAVAPSAGGYITPQQTFGQSPHLNALTASCKYGGVLTDYGNGNKFKNSNDLYLNTHQYDNNPAPHNFGYASAHNSQPLYNSNPHQSMTHGPAPTSLLTNDPLGSKATSYINDLTFPTSNFDNYHPHLDTQPSQQTIAGIHDQQPPPAYEVTVAKRALLDYRKPIQPQPPPIGAENCYTNLPIRDHYNPQELLNTPETTATFGEYETHKSHTANLAAGVLSEADRDRDENNKNLSLRDFIANWNDDEDEYQNNEEMSFDQDTVINEVLQTASVDQEAAAAAATVTAVEEVKVIKPFLAENKNNEPLQQSLNSVEDLSATLSEADAGQYVNLPDIVIDIEKSNNVNSSITTPAPSPPAMPPHQDNKNSMNLSDFDVEKELDELNLKKPGQQELAKDLHDGKDSPKVNVTPQISSCKNLTFEDLNLEATNKTVLNAVSASLTTNHNSNLTDQYIEGYESSSSRHSNESAFEKEYETFINKITSESGAKKTRKGPSATALVTDVDAEREVDFEKHVHDFSKFYKRKRKLKEDEVMAATPATHSQKKLKAAEVAKVDNSNFPQAYTKKSRNKLTNKRTHDPHKRKPKSAYYKIIHSIRRFGLYRAQRVREYMAELKEKHLPLIKRQSIKNYTHDNTESMCNAKSLKSLCIMAINTEEFRDSLLFSMAERRDNVPESEEKHICTDPSCETCEVIKSLMEADNFETTLMQQAAGPNEESASFAPTMFCAEGGNGTITIFEATTNANDDLSFRNEAPIVIANEITNFAYSKENFPGAFDAKAIEKHFLNTTDVLKMDFMSDAESCAPPHLDLRAKADYLDIYLQPTSESLVTETDDNLNTSVGQKTDSSKTSAVTFPEANKSAINDAPTQISFKSEKFAATERDEESESEDSDSSDSDTDTDTNSSGSDNKSIADKSNSNNESSGTDTEADTDNEDETASSESDESHQSKNIPSKRKSSSVSRKKERDNSSRTDIDSEDENIPSSSPRRIVIRITKSLSPNDQSLRVENVFEKSSKMQVEAESQIENEECAQASSKSTSNLSPEGCDPEKSFEARSCTNREDNFSKNNSAVTNLAPLKLVLRKQAFSKEQPLDDIELDKNSDIESENESNNEDMSQENEKTLKLKRKQDDSMEDTFSKQNIENECDYGVISKVIRICGAKLDPRKEVEVSDNFDGYESQIVSTKEAEVCEYKNFEKSLEACGDLNESEDLSNKISKDNRISLKSNSSSKDCSEDFSTEAPNEVFLRNTISESKVETVSSPQKIIVEEVARSMQSKFTTESEFENKKLKQTQKDNGLQEEETPFIDDVFNANPELSHSKSTNRDSLIEYDSQTNAVSTDELEAKTKSSPEHEVCSTLELSPRDDQRSESESEDDDSQEIIKETIDDPKERKVCSTLELSPRDDQGTESESDDDDSQEIVKKNTHDPKEHKVCSTLELSPRDDQGTESGSEDDDSQEMMKEAADDPKEREVCSTLELSPRNDHHGTESESEDDDSQEIVKKNTHDPEEHEVCSTLELSPRDDQGTESDSEDDDSQEMMKEAADDPEEHEACSTLELSPRDDQRSESESDDDDSQEIVKENTHDPKEHKVCSTLELSPRDDQGTESDSEDDDSQEMMKEAADDPKEREVCSTLELSPRNDHGTESESEDDEMQEIIKEYYDDPEEHNLTKNNFESSSLKEIEEKKSDITSNEKLDYNNAETCSKSIEIYELTSSESESEEGESDVESVLSISESSSASEYESDDSDKRSEKIVKLNNSNPIVISDDESINTCDPKDQLPTVIKTFRKSSDEYLNEIESNSEFISIKETQQSSIEEENELLLHDKPTDLVSNHSEFSMNLKNKELKDSQAVQCPEEEKESFAFNYGSSDDDSNSETEFDNPREPFPDKRNRTNSEKYDSEQTSSVEDFSEDTDAEMSDHSTQKDEEFLQLEDPPATHLENSDYDESDVSLEGSRSPEIRQNISGKPSPIQNQNALEISDCETAIVQSKSNKYFHIEDDVFQKSEIKINEDLNASKENYETAEMLSGVVGDIKNGTTQSQEIIYKEKSVLQAEMENTGTQSVDIISVNENQKVSKETKSLGNDFDENASENRVVEIKSCTIETPIPKTEKVDNQLQDMREASVAAADIYKPNKPKNDVVEEKFTVPERPPLNADENTYKSKEAEFQTVTEAENKSQSGFFEKHLTDFERLSVNADKNTNIIEKDENTSEQIMKGFRNSNTPQSDAFEEELRDFERPPASIDANTKISGEAEVHENSKSNDRQTDIRAPLSGDAITNALHVLENKSEKISKKITMKPESDVSAEVLKDFVEPHFNRAANSNISEESEDLENKIEDIVMEHKKPNKAQEDLTESRSHLVNTDTIMNISEKTEDLENKFKQIVVEVSILNKSENEVLEKHLTKSIISPANTDEITNISEEEVYLPNSLNPIIAADEEIQYEENMTFEESTTSCPSAIEKITLQKETKEKIICNKRDSKSPQDDSLAIRETTDLKDTPSDAILGISKEKDLGEELIPTTAEDAIDYFTSVSEAKNVDAEVSEDTKDLKEPLKEPVSENTVITTQKLFQNSNISASFNRETPQASSENHIAFNRTVSERISQAEENNSECMDKVHNNEIVVEISKEKESEATDFENTPPVRKPETRGGILTNGAAKIPEDITKTAAESSARLTTAKMEVPEEAKVKRSENISDPESPLNERRHQESDAPPTTAQVKESQENSSLVETQKIATMTGELEAKGESMKNVLAEGSTPFGSLEETAEAKIAMTGSNRVKKLDEKCIPKDIFSSDLPDIVDQARYESISQDKFIQNSDALESLQIRSPRKSAEQILENSHCSEVQLAAELKTVNAINSKQVKSCEEGSIADLETSALAKSKLISETIQTCESSAEHVINKSETLTTHNKLEYEQPVADKTSEIEHPTETSNQQAATKYCSTTDEMSADFFGFKNQSSFEDESEDFHGFEDLEEVTRIRQEMEKLSDDSTANDGFLNNPTLNRQFLKATTASLTDSMCSEVNELEALEKELSQPQPQVQAEDDHKETEQDLPTKPIEAASSNDIEHIKQMLESDEELPTDGEDKCEKPTRLCKNKSVGDSKNHISKYILSSVNSVIPKLSDLCRAALNSSSNSNSNLAQPANSETSTFVVERELSVEEALAEMYRQAGVLLSDPEDCDSDMPPPSPPHNEAHDVLLINLQEILNSDNDVYVLQCDMNENVLNVVRSTEDPVVERQGSEATVNTERVNTLQIIVDTQNSDPQIHIISSDSESEVIILSDDDSEFNYRQLSSNPERVTIPFINDNDINDSDSLFDISTIHHEEIVPDNLNKFLQEEFYKYLHEKYVQRNISKYYHANRVLKKYKRRFIRTNRQ